MSGSNFTTTPNLGLYKPTYDADEEMWGNHLNINADTLDALLGPQGKWAQLPIVSVLDHGAKGDGASDDTTAIQNTVTAYAGKAVIVVPNTGNAYLVNPIVLPSGTDILVYGTLRGVSANNGVLTISGGSNITVRGTGTIDANNTTAAGVFLNNASNVQIRDITIRNAQAWNFNAVSSSHVLLDHVSMFGGTNSPHFAQGSRDCWIVNSYINGPNADGGFAFYGGVTNSGAIGNVFTNAFGNGCSVVCDTVQTAVCSGIVIANNIVHDNLGQGIAVLAVGVGGYHSNITITGNECFNNCAAAVTAGPPACDIFLASCYYSIIAGNKLHHCGHGGHGIVLSGSGYGPNDGLTIYGNDISEEGQGGAGAIGIDIAGIAANLAITGNHIYDFQSTPTMTTGIAGDLQTLGTVFGNTIVVTTPLNITTHADSVVMNSVGGTLVAGSPASFNQGIILPANVDSGPDNAALHINLFGGNFGIGVTAGRLNYFVSSGGGHYFRVAGADRLGITATGMGFNGTAPVAKPTVTGAKGGNAALASLLTALASYGLITDSSTT